MNPHKDASHYFIFSDGTRMYPLYVEYYSPTVGSVIAIPLLQTEPKLSDELTPKPPTTLNND